MVAYAEAWITLAHYNLVSVVYESTWARLVVSKGEKTLVPGLIVEVIALPSEGADL